MKHIKQKIEEFLRNYSDRSIIVVKDKGTKSQREWCESELMSLLEIVAKEVYIQCITDQIKLRKDFDDYWQQFKEQMK